MADALKFDVRVRERLLKKGLLTEAEVEQHLSALPDRADSALEVGIKQPALQTEAEREVLVVRTLARPAQPVPPPRMFGDDDDAYSDKLDADIDDDDDDDEDDDEAKPGKDEKAKADAAKPDAPKAEAEGKADAPKPDAEGKAEKSGVDDDWG
jgi:hypothetical protein